MTATTISSTDRLSIIPLRRPDESLWETFFGGENYSPPTVGRRYTHAVAADHIQQLGSMPVIVTVSQENVARQFHALEPIKSGGHVTPMSNMIRDIVTMTIGSAPLIQHAASIFGSEITYIATSSIDQITRSYEGSFSVTVQISESDPIELSEITREDHKLLMSALYAGSKFLYEF